ncbi:MAG TPA: hypothetical protein VF665_11655 [Longimicrobium sp.]|jgi:hypothetical protein|uniref:hypothetical protein n=1 Tax=Longimicrobium sp. TaxID=2029185 RepID=UPI002EDAF9AC
MRNLISSSFLRGIGRVLDFRGAVPPRYVRPASTPVSDQAAIAADWEAVWGDLSIACGRVMGGSPARREHGR